MNRNFTEDEIRNTLLEMGEKARIAAHRLAIMSTEEKNDCLRSMADALEAESANLKKENEKDLEAGKKSGLSSAMLDRLALTDKVIISMAKGLRDVADLEDPVGRRLGEWIRPNELDIHKVSVPIGVIAIVYESRPNVTVDAAGLCLKAGNAVILRGGKEAINSNIALAHCMNRAALASGLPEGAVQLIPWTDRIAVDLMLKMDKYIDLVIPRGGESLIRAVVENSTIPVIKHYKGICHVYVDSEADINMALKIVENAKCQRPGTCNAAETLLIHKDIAAKFAPKIADVLEKRKVEMRGDSQFRKLVPEAKPASEEDWSTEYLDLIISIMIVPSLDAAIEHINLYGSKHSDAIVTKNQISAKRFLSEVDSAAVYVNASTRFTDGGEFGMGAEIGISTDKLHARGPMGLAELTSYKYIIYGNGQCRE
ncbi:MAG TPA: glutamate-5-semialdehyde dehydrogenase [Lentisphaeria bacterium]|nr:MAG: glutamate-5-semialdehyde dehydrogenase [Lentisphaerae bacterium GWF2_49_21]HBC86566.1 glutamate-5-semialdehyde dehydrogenase [Lentisphaeria bacterium]